MPSAKSRRRSRSALMLFRYARAPTAARPSWWPITSSCLSARSQSPAKQSSSNRKVRSPVSDGSAFTPRVNSSIAGPSLPSSNTALPCDTVRPPPQLRSRLSGARRDLNRSRWKTLPLLGCTVRRSPPTFNWACAPLPSPPPLSANMRSSPHSPAYGRPRAGSCVWPVSGPEVGITDSLTPDLLPGQLKGGVGLSCSRTPPSISTLTTASRGGAASAIWYSTFGSAPPPGKSWSRRRRAFFRKLTNSGENFSAPSFFGDQSSSKYGLSRSLTNLVSSPFSGLRKAATDVTGASSPPSANGKREASGCQLLAYNCRHAPLICSKSAPTSITFRLSSGCLNNFAAASPAGDAPKPLASNRSPTDCCAARRPVVSRPDWSACASSPCDLGLAASWSPADFSLARNSVIGGFSSPSETKRISG